jgi:hypothetical protein
MAAFLQEEVEEEVQVVAAAGNLSGEETEVAAASMVVTDLGGALLEKIDSPPVAVIGKGSIPPHL